METFSLTVLIQVFRDFGPFGIIVVMWWVDMKSIKKILDCYKRDMAEMRGMYESNVRLVEKYESVAADLQDVVIMNTQAMTKICADVEQNQFCPMVRMEKKAQGVQGP